MVSDCRENSFLSFFLRQRGREPSSILGHLAGLPPPRIPSSVPHPLSSPNSLFLSYPWSLKSQNNECLNPNPFTLTITCSSNQSLRKTEFRNYNSLRSIPDFKFRVLPDTPPSPTVLTVEC